MENNMPDNIQKRVPKNDIKFSITLSDEQKAAKAQIIETPFNFIIGKAGSGKTLLACQIALDLFFKRQVSQTGGVGMDGISASPYRMGYQLINRVRGLIQPYSNPNSLVG